MIEWIGVPCVRHQESVQWEVGMRITAVVTVNQNGVLSSCFALKVGLQQGCVCDVTWVRCHLGFWMEC